jgi:hypothetical protein
VRSYFGEQKIILQKVKIVAKPLILEKNVLIIKVFIGAHFSHNKLYGTIRDSRSPENLTLESGVGVGVDFFLGVGSGSGLPQMLRRRHQIAGQIVGRIAGHDASGHGPLQNIDC